MDEHPLMDEWRRLRDKVLRAQAETLVGQPIAFTDLGQPLVPQQSRRVRQVWREEDDYLFNAGFRAWIATDHP